MSEYLPDRLEMQTEINKLRKQNEELIEIIINRLTRINKKSGDFMTLSDEFEFIKLSGVVEKITGKPIEQILKDCE